MINEIIIFFIFLIIITGLLLGYVFNNNITELKLNTNNITDKIIKAEELENIKYSNYNKNINQKIDELNKNIENIQKYNNEKICINSTCITQYDIDNLLKLSQMALDAQPVSSYTPASYVPSIITYMSDSSSEEGKSK